MSLTWDDKSPDHWAPRGAVGETETGMEGGTRTEETSERREAGVASGKREVTGESLAGRMGLVEEVAISES